MFLGNKHGRDVRRRRRRGRGQEGAPGSRRVPEVSPRSSTRSARASRAACCSSALRAPARRCWRAPSPARPACRSSASPARSSSRCSSASAPAASATCSTRPSATRPCIVFVDEIDAVGRQRGAGLGGSHDEREQTLNQILVEMDGFDTNTNVIVIAATNRPDVLDPALLRPGRFDRQVILDRPDMKGRVAILKVHIEGQAARQDGRRSRTSRASRPGFSGADLANLVNEARDPRRPAQQEGHRHDRVRGGARAHRRRPGAQEPRHLRRREADHRLPRGRPRRRPARPARSATRSQKVTIISRGMALGYTMALPTEDRYLQSKTEFEDKIAGLLGGNAAERLVFGDTTTGASNDIEKATDLARRMVTEFGMSDRLGPLSFGKRDELVFLGREIGEQRNYSDEVAKKIDEEVRAIIDQAYERAMRGPGDPPRPAGRAGREARRRGDRRLRGLRGALQRPAAEGGPPRRRRRRRPEPAGPEAPTRRRARHRPTPAATPNRRTAAAGAESPPTRPGTAGRRSAPAPRGLPARYHRETMTDQSTPRRGVPRRDAERAPRVVPGASCGSRASRRCRSTPPTAAGRPNGSPPT